MNRSILALLPRLAALAIFVAGCIPAQSSISEWTPTPQPSPTGGPTPIPLRTANPPGELADYIVQNGDTLPAIAAHFNTTVQEILDANQQIPANATTLPAGYPLRVPAYYIPLTGSTFHVLPDSEVINGPSAIGFELQNEIEGRNGFLRNQSDYAYRLDRPAWEVVDIIAKNYSLHPRLLLALLEFQTHALSDPTPTDEALRYPMGYPNPRYKGLFRQLLWAAEQLCDGYYGWRTGRLREFSLQDGLLTRPDPWQNAGTVAVQHFFAGIKDSVEFEMVVGVDGFYQTYTQLWGDPFEKEIEFIPGGLQQPYLTLPFVPNRIWDYTGGPHSSWGSCLPWGALDFAPPAVKGGCTPSREWIAAPAEGVIARSGEAIVMLDLDGDGDERTGWTLFFFHVATEDRIETGTVAKTGDLLGYPSCEGGQSTGTHFHFARKYNGEWMPAGGPLPINLNGWIADYGDEPYQGILTKGSKIIYASTATTKANRIIYELLQDSPSSH